MNKKKVLPLALLGAVVLILAILLLVLQTVDSSEEDTGIPLCSLNSGEVTSLYYRDASAEEPVEVSLTKTDGTWTLDSDPALPIDQSKADAITADLTALTAQRQLTDDADVEEMGFDDPTQVITLSTGSDQWELTVGSKNSMTDTWYVRTSEDGPVYTVSLTDLSDICKTPKQLYAAQDITDIESDAITTMTVQSGGNTLSFIQTDGTWTLSDDPDYSLDQDLVNTMANTICDMTTDWSITSPEADSTYGLDTPNVVVTIVSADGSVQCSFGGTDPEDDSLNYLRSSAASDVVYEVSSENLSAFAYDKASLKAATPESAETADVVAEDPVGGADDFADATS